jgi:hypothetical protein
MDCKLGLQVRHGGQGLRLHPGPARLSALDAYTRSLCPYVTAIGAIRLNHAGSQ